MKPLLLTFAVLAIVGGREAAPMTYTFTAIRHPGLGAPLYSSLGGVIRISFSGPQALFGATSVPVRSSRNFGLDSFRMTWDASTRGVQIL